MPSPYEWQFKLADLGISHFKKVSSSRENSTASDTYGTRTYGIFSHNLKTVLCADNNPGAPECFRPDIFSGQTKLKVNQNIDIWSLGCIYSEAVRWLPLSQKYTGILEYAEERKAEINKIPAFDGVDCFHNGQKVLDAVHESNDRALEGILRKDFITEKVIGMIVDDMLVDSEARSHAHWLWSKHLRILEMARKNLKKAGVPSLPPFVNQVPNGHLPLRPTPQPRYTHPVQAPLANPPLPPVLPPGFGQETTARPAVYRNQWDTTDSSRTQMYDNNPMVLGDEEGVRRHSPDALTELGNEEVTPSPSSGISASHTISQQTSPVPSPSQQPSYSRPNYQYLEDIGEDPFGGTSSTINRQTSRNRPRGTSQMSLFSNPRYSAPATGVSQTINTSPKYEQQRQSFPNQRMPTNRTQSYNIWPNPSYNLPNSLVSEYRAQQNATSSQNYYETFSSPGITSNDQLGHISNTNSTNLHYLPLQQQQSHRPQPVAIQDPATTMTLQDALDWRDRCKETGSHARGLNKDLLNRLRDRDHVSSFDPPPHPFSYCLA